MSFISDKQIKNIDEILFSGSSDTFRTNLGLYVEVVQSSGSSNKNLFDPIVEIATAKSFDLNEQEAYALDNDYTDKVIYIQSNTTLQTTASNSTVLKTVRYPVRVIGTNDASVLKTNEQWKAMVLGGTYEDYDLHAFDY